MKGGDSFSSSNSDSGSKTSRYSSSTYSELENDMVSSRMIKDIGGYIADVTRSLMRKDKEQAVATWGRVVEKIKTMGNEKSLHGATKILAEIFFDFKDYPRALE